MPFAEFSSNVWELTSLSRVIVNFLWRIETLWRSVKYFKFVHRLRYCLCKSFSSNLCSDLKAQFDSKRLLLAIPSFLRIKLYSVDKKTLADNCRFSYFNSLFWHEKVGDLLWISRYRFKSRKREYIHIYKKPWNLPQFINVPPEKCSLFLWSVFIPPPQPTASNTPFPKRDCNDVWYATCFIALLRDKTCCFHRAC